MLWRAGLDTIATVMAVSSYGHPCIWLWAALMTASVLALWAAFTPHYHDTTHWACSVHTSCQLHLSALAMLMMHRSATLPVCNALEHAPYSRRVQPHSNNVLLPASHCKLLVSLAGTIMIAPQLLQHHGTASSLIVLPSRPLCGNAGWCTTIYH
jgi:hypothetical protein